MKLDTGAWRDEANPSDHGSDLISLYAALQCAGDQGRALRELAAEFAISRTAAPAAPQTAQVTKSKSEWRPIIPVPADAPDYRTQWGHFARGTPDQHWRYRDAEDRLLYVVCRFDTADGGKDVQPLSFCEKPNGTRAWRYKAPGEPRPLYGLHRLASPAASVVFVVEGGTRLNRFIGQAI